MKEIFLEDDGLIAPEVGWWSEKKYSLVKYCTQIFTKAMKEHWDCRVYIDLFAGPGRSKVKESEFKTKIVLASPLLALSAEYPFDKYIFCEFDKEKMNVLKERVECNYPTLKEKTKFLQCDVNISIRDILNLMPPYTKNYRVLTFCFVDPYTISNLSFETIRVLGSKYLIDFFILIPSFHPANRFEKYYSTQGKIIMDKFLGTDTWLEEWNNIKSKKKLKFGNFVVHTFGKQMESIKLLDYPSYINKGLQGAEEIHNAKTPIYHLCFFSRHKRGIEFWEKARKGTDMQGRLFD